MRNVDQSELDAILNVTSQKAMISYRNNCIMVLMIRYGMRIVDLISLKVQDVDWGTGIVSLRRKERVYRAVTLTEADLSMVRGLLSLYRDFSDFSWIFCSYHGNKLSNHLMIKMMKAIAKKADVQVTTKDINATYIARRVEREDISEVAKDLGYSSGEYLERFLVLEEG